MKPRQLAKVIADSLSPDGVRLTTMEIVLPRIVLAELNTHRMLSKSSASSRAIPVEKMIAAVENDPYIPEQWDRNGAGMQGHGTIDSPHAIAGCVRDWLDARDAAVASAQNLLARNVHKQITNRLLEPFMWHTVIVSATEWSNFFNLRCNPLAHPALRNTAEAIREVMATNTPSPIAYGEWHLPYFDPTRDADVAGPTNRVKVCVARCARVSYLTHDGVRDPSKDIALADSLLANGHMAPLEHVARPMTDADAERCLREQGAGGEDLYADVYRTFAGNFRGWMQYRKTIAGEADILAHRSAS
jgi:thymidylate synthase ThyX